MTAQAALDASARKMEEGFAGVAGQLSDVRGSLQDLVARLADLDRVLNEQSAQGRVTGIVGQAAGNLKEALRAASGVAAPHRVSEAPDAAQAAVATIEARTRMLDAVATLSLITARSLWLDGFDVYVRNLRSLGDDMAQDATRVGAAVAALRGRRERAGELAARAEEALDQVNAALESHARERADTARLLALTIDGVGAVARRLPGVLAAETDALVQAMQFADAVAQRIDHIRTLLARGGAAELALAAAQTEALVEATRDTVSAVRTSLSRIEAAAAEAGRVLSAGGGSTENAAARAVDLGRSLLTSLAGASARALEAIDGAAGESAALNDLAEEAAQRFASLAGATGAIHIAAINAALLSRTENGQERAMNVLSFDVQQQAGACAAASDACKAAMTDLILADDLAVFAAVSDTALVFRRSVAETAGAISSAEAALADMENLREAAAGSLEALGPAILRAGGSMGRIAASADDLVRLAGALPRTVPAGSDPLAELLDLYTMEAERDVHRRLFGLPDAPDPARSAAAPSAGPDVDADPLASVLF